MSLLVCLPPFSLYKPMIQSPLDNVDSLPSRPQHAPLQLRHFPLAGDVCRPSPGLLTPSARVMTLTPPEDMPLLAVASPASHSSPRVGCSVPRPLDPSVYVRAECTAEHKDVICIYKPADCKYKVCLQRVYGHPLSFYTLTPFQGAGVNCKWLCTRCGFG